MPIRSHSPFARTDSESELISWYFKDELPQLINILKGDMSIVGPRPVVDEELNWYGDKKDKLLSVKPGLTGWWAVNGRSNVPYPERCDLELYYVDHISFALDVKIILKTLGAIIKKDGARYI